MPGFTFRTLTKWVQSCVKGWFLKMSSKKVHFSFCVTCNNVIDTPAGRSAELHLMCIKTNHLHLTLKKTNKKNLSIYRPVWVDNYFVKRSKLHPSGCLIAGCGCGWRDLVVSQLFANSRASHSGCGQVQEPGVDRQQDDRRLDTSLDTSAGAGCWVADYERGPVTQPLQHSEGAFFLSFTFLQCSYLCISWFLPDPFVKVYLLQDGRKISKKKTSTKRDDTNPIFNEAMIFSVPSNVLQVRTISQLATNTWCHTWSHVSAGTLLEGNSGRDHRWRPWREPRSCDYRPRGQRDGDHSLEPDAGHSEEARVHVAPPAQDLVLIFPSRVNETLCSSCSFHLCPGGAAVSLKDKKVWLTPYLQTRGRNLKSQCQTGAGSDWIALSFHSCACYRLQIVNVDFT